MRFKIIQVHPGLAPTRRESDHLFTKRAKTVANLVRTILADAQQGKHWQFCEFQASLRVHVTNSSFLIGFAVKLSGHSHVRN